MKLIILLVTSLLLTGAGIYAQNYSPADAPGSVKFVISNFGFDVDGSFGVLKGSILFDEKNLSRSVFNVTVQSATVNTGNQTRDKHLRGKDYFDVSGFPVIQLSSQKIEKSETPGFYVFYGKLLMKGVTKEIRFPFQAVAEKDGFRFTGSFSIKRRDFGVGGRSTVSNDVDIKLNVFAKKL